MPTVCALVLTRNRRELLLECLAALERQTAAVARVVVVDNASSDDTEAAVRGLGLGDRLVYRRLERNVGSAGGYSVGIEVARELDVDWIWIMDDDAEAPEDSLERLLAAPAASDPETAALASAVVVPGGEIDVLHRGFMGRFMRALPREEYRPGNHAELGFSSFTGLMVSARVARAEDPPRADFFIWADDVEYTIRLRRHGRIVMVPEATIVHKTRMGGRGNTLRGRIVNRLLGVEYPSADWDTYWKNLHSFRNFAWIKREHYGAGARELATVAAAYVAKSLLYDAHPLRRVPWILWAVERGRRGEPLGMPPERWERIAREGLRPPRAAEPAR
jgi:rhamnopyranosyl-N-acetylglucosaminyl-diphospho-decaprenol beta-1,3/1,4-galactofuranosyltransferase